MKLRCPSWLHSLFPGKTLDWPTGHRQGGTRGQGRISEVSTNTLPQRCREGTQSCSLFAAQRRNQLESCRLLHPQQFTTTAQLLNLNRHSASRLPPATSHSRPCRSSTRTPTHPLASPNST